MITTWLRSHLLFYLLQHYGKNKIFNNFSFSLHEYLTTKIEDGVDPAKIAPVQQKMVYNPHNIKIQTVCDVCGINRELQTDCFKLIKILVEKFQRIYPELGNLERYG